VNSSFNFIAKYVLQNGIFLYESLRKLIHMSFKIIAFMLLFFTFNSVFVPITITSNFLLIFEMELHNKNGFNAVLPQALWNGRTVESIFGACVDWSTNRCPFHAEVTLQRSGWVPPLEMQVVSKKSIVFLSSSFLRSRSLFCRGRKKRVNETNTFRA
jgi:hypothetical protein